MRKYPFDFLVLPEAIWLDERLSYGAKHLLAILLRYSNEGFYKEVSHRWLGEKMKVKEWETKDRVKELVENGYITKIPRKNSVNGYKINISFWLSSPQAQIHPPVSTTPGEVDSTPPNTREIVQENTNSLSAVSSTANQDEMKYEPDKEVMPVRSPVRPSALSIKRWQESKQIREWAELRMGQKFPNRVMQQACIKRMLLSGFSPKSILEQWEVMEESDFWAERGFDFGNVLREIGKTRSKSKFNPRIHAR